MFKVKDEAQRAIVYIYGTIGEDWWSPEDENRAKEFAQKLDDLSPKPLDIHIDSAGGDVYEGFAIASAINRYEGDTCAYVDGLAASAASYIALMADKVVMNDYAMLMIHNAWTMAMGNRDELRDVAQRLEELDKTIAGIISARSALTPDEVSEAMCAETWYTAADAEAAGMCDEVLVTEQRMAACVDKTIARYFAHIPENVELVDEPEGDGKGEPLPAIDEPADEREDGGESATSHTLPTLSDNEAKDAVGAILLGNRVYRKETER